MGIAMDNAFSTFGSGSDALQQPVLALATALGGPLLGLETSTMQASLAVADPHSQRLYQKLLPAHSLPSEHLVDGIAHACAALGMAPNSFRAIVVGHGPGSFTGLRVSLATAHGLVLGSQARLVGVSSLATLALSTHVRASCKRAVLVVLDARCGELYAAIYQHKETPSGMEQQAVLADTVLSPMALRAAVQQAMPPDGLLCVGDFAARFCADWDGVSDSLLGAGDVYPQAQAAMFLATKALHEPALTPNMGVLPRYLRACTAERRLDAMRDQSSR